MNCEVCGKEITNKMKNVCSHRCRMQLWRDKTNAIPKWEDGRCINVRVTPEQYLEWKKQKAIRSWGSQIDKTTLQPNRL
jgi:hypothetical protein